MTAGHHVDVIGRQHRRHECMGRGKAILPAVAEMTVHRRFAQRLDEAPYSPLLLDRRKRIGAPGGRAAGLGYLRDHHAVSQVGSEQAQAIHRGIWLAAALGCVLQGQIAAERDSAQPDAAAARRTRGCDDRRLQLRERAAIGQIREFDVDERDIRGYVPPPDGRGVALRGELLERLVRARL